MSSCSLARKLCIIEGSLVHWHWENLMPRGAECTEPNKEPEDSDEITWVLGELAKSWERDDVIRGRARSTGCLTKWLSPKTKGIASMRAIDLNCDPLLLIARKWCPLCKQAKCPPVPLLKAEARCSNYHICTFLSCLCVYACMYMYMHISYMYACIYMCPWPGT